VDPPASNATANFSVRCCLFVVALAVFEVTPSKQPARRRQDGSPKSLERERGVEWTRLVVEAEAARGRVATKEKDFFVVVVCTSCCVATGSAATEDGFIWIDRDFDVTHEDTHNKNHLFP